MPSKPSNPSPRRKPARPGSRPGSRSVPSQPGTTGSKRPRTMGHDSAPGGTRRPRGNSRTKRRGGGATY